MSTASPYCPSCGALNTVGDRICFACQHVLDEPVHEIILHNRYHLLSQVGKGGFGAVHKAEDTQQQNAIVAIKQINLRGLTPQEVIEATDGFNREISLLSDLSHPHLPRIYEHFTDPDHWYLVMDFIEGETLESYLEKTYMKRGSLTPLPLSEVLDIGLQVCNVLDYLHTRQPAIIFRDVKPANLMRTPTSTLYLIDFGIARHYKPGKPKDTIPFGSPGYAAPEQYGKAQTSPSSDIYSLGALLHMLLSGNDPVDTPFHFDPLRLYGDEGVAEVCTLIERMVTLDANQRPQRVCEVREQLRHINDLQQHLPLMVAAPSPPPPLVIQPVSNDANMGRRMQQMMVQRRQLRQQRRQYWSPTKRKNRRDFVVGTASVLGGLAVVTAGLSALAHAPGARNGGFPGSSTVSEGEGPSTSSLFGTPYPLAHLYSDPPVDAVTWSPHSTRVAFAGGTLIGVQGIHTDYASDTPDDRLLTQNVENDHVASLAWQPTKGDTLAYIVDDMLYLWSGNWTGVAGVTKGNTLSFIQVKQQVGTMVNTRVPILTMAWSPDGKYIAIPFEHGVQVWDATKRMYVKSLYNNLSRRLTLTITSLAWSPDGQYIAATQVNGQAFLWSLSDGRIHPIYTDTTPAFAVSWSPNSQFLAFACYTHAFVTTLSNVLPVTNNSQNAASPSLSNFTTYNGHQGDINALSWSPDGRYIASGSLDRENNLHVWTPFVTSHGVPPAKGETRLGNPTPGGDFTFSTSFVRNDTGINALSWSPNGSSLLIGSGIPCIIPLKIGLL